MSPTKKKRKLNDFSQSVGQATPLSAIAARRALESKNPTNFRQDEGFQTNLHGESSIPATSGPRSVKPVIQEPLTTEEAAELGGDSRDRLRFNTEEEIEQAAVSTSVSRATSPEVAIQRPSITFSSFKPSKGNVRKLKDGSVFIRLTPGERLVLVGQYSITVQKGQITLMGATLLVSKTLYRIFAPSSHALPVIRCQATDVDAAEICLHQLESGLGHLNSLSPLFGKLWNDGTGSLGSELDAILGKRKSSTYQTVRSDLNLIEPTLNWDQLFSSQEDPLKSFLTPLISPAEWNAALSKLTETTKRSPAIFVCGPKSSGKSTFAKLLANRFWSNTLSSSKGSPATGLAILDLDPGQPEYSTPGHLSLVYLQEPNFGPPYAHPIPSGKSRTIRSHAIGSITPSMDTSFYMACAADLFNQYQTLLSTNLKCPLIINTPGWVLGTGLEILIDLVTKIRPTDIVYMSQSGPPEVTTSLKEAGKGTPLFTLPSQLSEYTTRTAAQLRTMQAMSHLHLDPSSNGDIFNYEPLTAIPPWELRYAGENPAIFGIVCYGEQPPANLLADTINGSLVSIVAIDDDAAISGLDSTGNEVPPEDPISLPTETDLRLFDHDQQPLQKPIIIRTPIEDLPYFNPQNSITLDPAHSHCEGLALIRGIDVFRRRIQILTPIASKEIEKLSESGKKIVLVSGKLDTPGWAYTEELFRKTWLEKESKNDVDAEIVESCGNFEDVPWVEKLEGSQGRGVGSRVWRVRRDLGKVGEGD